MLGSFLSLKKRYIPRENHTVSHHFCSLCSQCDRFGAHESQSQSIFQINIYIYVFIYIYRYVYLWNKLGVLFSTVPCLRPWVPAAIPWKRLHRSFCWPPSVPICRSTCRWECSGTTSITMESTTVT